MIPKKSLPILLLSVADSNTADDIISNLVEGSAPLENAPGRVWRIVNKYYTAEVDIRAHIDGELLQVDTNLIEGHVIYLSELECTTSKEVLERRAASVGAEGLGEVRLLLVESSEEPAEAVEWAMQKQYEVVTLRTSIEEKEEEEEEDEGAAGWQRTREALHAHVWSGLSMLDKTAQPPSVIESLNTLNDDCEWGEWSSSDGSGRVSDEEGAVQRAELFAAALERVPDARGPGPDGDRRRRAEELVSAFCRALGHDLDAL